MKSKSHLPTNRKEGFFDIITNQFSVVLKLGLLTLIFLLPIITLLILTNIKLYEVNLSLKEGIITDTASLSESNGLLNGRNLLFILFIPFFVALMSGIFNIIKKLVWQEGILFLLDFKKGIKDNALFFFFFSLLASILYYLFSYTLRSELVSHDISTLVACLFSGMALLILFLLMPLLLHQTLIYNLSVMKKLKNALIIFTRMFYIFIPLGILNLLPILMLFVNNGILLIILIILNVLIIIPLIIIINTFVTNYAFDFFINYYHFKEIYRKGLFDNAEDNNQ